MIRILISISLVFLFACNQKEKTTDTVIPPIDIVWTIDSISTVPKAMTYATFEVYNKSERALSPSAWSLHFNQIGGRPHADHIPSNITFDNPSGDYLVITMKDSLPAKETLKFSYGIGGYIDKMSESPRGIFAVIDGLPTPIIATTINGLDETTLAELNPATDKSRYEEYAELSIIDRDMLLPLIPSPQVYSTTNGSSSLGTSIAFNVPSSMDDFLDAIGNHQVWLGAKFKKTASDADVNINIDEELKIKSEGYQLSIANDHVNINASDTEGAYYGVQSFLQLLYHNQLPDGTFELNNLEITDYPRFGYRGFHLDVSRNFHSVTAVKKILDMMAFFKLNKFHFHLTDDEGWRLEIPGLPELTTLGAHRGYTNDEHDHLRPAYGSGPDPENSYGSGFYTTEEFQDILKYAKKRHIKVIPEIDLPGHARAAIKAMESRYRRYMSEGNSAEANKYLLSDANDESKYGSAQGYSDNVICVCQEGAFNFVEHVLEAVVQMYQDADAEINYLHIGGDEIPSGSWEGSPVCKKFIRDMDQIASIPELPVNFISNMRGILDRHNITIAGWEEIMLVHSDQGHNTLEINHEMIDGKTLPYVWNAVWGWEREDMIYRLANAGSPVVMANSAAFYFDMAYDNGPDEIGLSWSGFANTKTAFGLDPLDMFKNARLDKNGKPLKDEIISNMVRLTPEGVKNFKGIQAELWSETVIAEKWLDYLMYPKMFGFSQRAWSSAGSWMQFENPQKVDQEFESQWNIFANTIGQKGLPMLDKMYDGIGYRLPRTGKDNKGNENTQFPGYIIR